ncbi:uncharacterized protein LOC135111523 isoform X2 [Scylla paramamosain]|uniref:uncharacterized protein LOC135111523 isoform X2 n=1 Tax=Scylla paramamosain TaxID=85552 RepID=UPI0030836350
MTRRDYLHSPENIYLRQHVPYILSERNAKGSGASVLRHVTMFAVLVAATWMVSCFRHANTIDLWADARSYFHYVLTKECFGEDIALQQEKEMMQRRRYCMQQAQGKDPLQLLTPLNHNNVLQINVDPDINYDTVNPPRVRRARVKQPKNPVLEVILCNLQQSKLICMH